MDEGLQGGSDIPISFLGYENGNGRISADGLAPGTVQNSPESDSEVE